MKFLEPNIDQYKRICHNLRWQEEVKKDIKSLRADITAFHKKHNNTTKMVINDESNNGKFIFYSPFVNGSNSVSIAEHVAKKHRTATMESDSKGTVDSPEKSSKIDDFVSHSVAEACQLPESISDSVCNSGEL
ncbi:hypothetical protein ARMSODRAFT_1019973 [Armillaria solidipes]|uniref:Uncharacterized protein n=1 Tax=Armillaria solidipes TaxID=1076256 RepID=A0A2H3BTL1_9AGAR|nr:hypothetical protein ARMSODRAFT_1019973 [Armillaria solidipes]